jgi:hypothetical protein
MRERAATQAILAVIDGNLPAYRLYESLGFEHYSGDVEFQMLLEQVPPAPALPDGYLQTPLKRFDWRPRYELEQQIAPDSLVRYEPVEVGRFRQPGMMRALQPLLEGAQGTRTAEVALYSAAGDRIVARGGYIVPTRGKGLNRINARLDPAHGELAPYLVGFLLRQVARLSSGRPVEMQVAQWMDPLVAAAEAAGFQRRMAYHRMGVML